MRHIVDPNCIFCEEVVKNVTFAECGDFRAIYNIAPILSGHSLIIPRYHISSLLELSDDEVTEMVKFSRVVVRNLVRIFGAQGFNWTIQEGAPAGQTVAHLHLHLIPRNDGDLPTPGDWYPRLLENESKAIDSEDRPRLTPDEMRRVTAHIRSEWESDA